MKFDLTGSGVVAVGAVGLVAVVAAVLYSKRKAIGESVNPMSSNNLAYRGVSNLGASVTGDADWTLGGWLAEKFSPAVAAANAELKRAPVVIPRPGIKDTITDRWDYYTGGGQWAASGSGGGAQIEADNVLYGGGTGYPVEYVGP